MAEVRSFEDDVILASHQVAVVVDFWAPWCGPCRVLGPILERLSAQANGEWMLAKVNVDEHPAEAQTYGVQGIPAVKLFLEGRVIAEFTGALPESAVVQWLSENLPSETRETLANARRAIDEGDRARARTLIEGVLAINPNDVEACLLMADLLFPDDPQQAEALAAKVPLSHADSDRAEAIRTLCRLLRLEDGADDSEGWKAYVEGAKALQSGNFERAVETWIEMISRRQRDVDDDGARRAVIALFHWLGADHPVTRGYQRAFSSALF